jgi:hypothetical protein
MANGGSGRLRRWGCVWMSGAPGDEHLEPFLEGAARKHDPATAAQTPQSDVCPDAHHNPVCRATGVWLSKANNVVNVDLQHHRASLTSGDCDGL